MKIYANSVVILNSLFSSFLFAFATNESFTLFVLFVVGRTCTMSLKKQCNNLQTTIFETLQTIMMLQDDESVVSSLIQAAAFEQTNNAFREHFQTGNLCSEDVNLPLKLLDASAEYTVVWLHCGAKLDDDTEEDAITKLHCVFNHVETFDTVEKCIHFLRELDANMTRLFFITSCFYDGMVCLWRGCKRFVQFSMTFG